MMRTILHLPASSLFASSLLAGTLFVAGCDMSGVEDFEPDYVVESYQVAGEPLAQVRLSRTASMNVAYDTTSQAVRGAEVRIDLLRADGSVETSYPFLEDRARRGVYLAEDTLARVLPLRTYRLDVTVADTGERLGGTTVVPDTFTVLQVEPSSGRVVYQSTEQLSVTMTRSSYPGRDQSYFILVTQALDAREETLTPFAAALLEEGDLEVTIEDLETRGSQILNEANYEIHDDGTLTVELPWLAILFYGPNRLSANVLDDNLYQYIRSQTTQRGGSTLAPGELANPINRVDGGLGVFGSYARVSVDVVIEKAQ